MSPATQTVPTDDLAPVPLRPLSVAQPACRFRLRPGDRPLVAAGDHVVLGEPLLERLRDAAAVERRLPLGLPEPSPGDTVEPDQVAPGGVRRGTRTEGPGRVLYLAPGRRLLVAVGRHSDVFPAPFAGTVESVDRVALVLRADGTGLPGAFAAGAASSGRLVVAVERPDAELPASALDVASEGAILVAGARIDVEAISRARAMGVRGLVVGGVVGRDLKAFVASEARQRAGLHTGLPFGLLVLDGFGKRPIPGVLWRALLAAEGHQVAIVGDPALLVLEPTAPLPAPEPETIRVAAGELAGREGRLLALLGRRRLPAGARQHAALVALAADGPGRPALRVALPLSDLERFG
ncbi:MAG TPA: hypothetical protein VFK38_09890 [Candidatus Limnocylindrales bacterium]|nr:hypothetical protein [Candidatus Limnocylindrales bacterium]